MTHIPKPKQEVKFYKKKRNIFIALGLIVVAWAYFALAGQTEVNMQTEVVKKGELIQEVNVTGSVKPAEKVSLGFEVSGKVEGIFAEVGDRVEVGQKLISLKSNDLLAQLRQAQAGVSSASALLQQYQAALEAQEAKLAELKSGTRPEEIQIAKTNVENTEKALEDAKNNLELTINKAEADLASIYNQTISILVDAVNEGKVALITLTNIQYEYFRYNDQDKYLVEGAKENAIFALFNKTNEGATAASNISRMNSGIYGIVQNLSLNAEYSEIDSAMSQTLNALQKIKYALDVVPIVKEMSEVAIATLDSGKVNMNSKITAVTNQQKAIEVQKAANENAVNAAETNINTAESSLKIAQDQLELKKAGYTIEQIRAQEALVNQAKANLASQRAQVNQAYASSQNYQAQLDKTVLYAPIAGLITKMEAKVGEIVFPSSPYSDSRTTFVSIISDKNYEIESSIAEMDIAKIQVGDPSKVTLDAYGDDIVFEAKVTSIDPAETLIEGIPTYKVTLQFTQENENIKSGMTANLDILTDKKEEVISIPQRAVIDKDGKKIVRLAKAMDESTVIEEIEVKTGLKGSDGRVEITEGLKEGDIVIISIDE